MADLQKVSQVHLRQCLFEQGLYDRAEALISWVHFAATVELCREVK